MGLTEGDKSGYRYRRTKGESHASPYYMPDSIQIRAQVEAKLVGRVTSPFATRACAEKPVLQTGIEAIDDAMGGIPCGVITEILTNRQISGKVKRSAFSGFAHNPDSPSRASF